FNNMIGNCNISWVAEFYADAFGRQCDDFTSYVRGVEISYAPDVIDAIFGFRLEDYCWVRQQRDAASLLRSMQRCSRHLLCQAWIGTITTVEDDHACRLLR
ncbi:hypothetical protein A2U01_0070034, partial [Trifolium medium]|nr:hypothetical protein [Trifolium medium]